MKRVLAGIGILLILFLLILPVLLPVPEAQDFSVYNDDDKGLSDFRNYAREKATVKTIVTSPVILEEDDTPEDSVYVAVGVSKKYSDVEMEAIINFLYQGGSIIIADDIGYAEELAESITEELPLGSTVGFSGRSVYSSEDSTALESMKVKFGGGTYDVSVSRPTALFAQGEDVTSLAHSSPNDFTDWDNDGRGEIGEVGSVPLAVSFKLDLGRGFLFGDPGIFTNGAMKEMDNANFTSDLLDYLLPDEGGKVFIDESRHYETTLSQADRGILGIVLSAGRGAISYLMLAVVSVAIAIILISRQDPEPWKHAFDIRGFHSSPIDFGERKRIREKLREELINRFEEKTGIMENEMRDLTDDELKEFLGDDLLVKIIKGRTIPQNDIEDAIKKIRRWTNE